jgi:hypothetical protein
MGYESMNPKSSESDLSETEPKSLTKGILANVLSPHPYLFWFSVGGPIMSRAISLNLTTPFAFIGSFYVLLVGSKILLAVLVGRSKSFLSGTFLYIHNVFIGSDIMHPGAFAFPGRIEIFGSDILLIDPQQIAFFVPNNNKRVVLKRVWYKYGMMAKGPSRQFEKNEETDVINR